MRGRSGSSTDTVTDIDLSSLGTQGIQITGATDGDCLGIAVANAGDVNGDGINDSLIGARGFRSTGAVFLIYGSARMTSMDLFSFTTGSAGVRYLSRHGNIDLGAAVTGLSDINGDGLADFAISDPRYNEIPGTNAGIVCVVYGSSTVHSADVVAGSTGV
jgi:hypothetical protein